MPLSHPQSTSSIVFFRDLTHRRFGMFAQKAASVLLRQLPLRSFASGPASGQLNLIKEVRYCHACSLSFTSVSDP